MFKRKKVLGLIFLSMGVGMLLAMLLPVWGYFIATLIVGFGFYLFFL